jgi:hypothetical protein
MSILSPQEVFIHEDILIYGDANTWGYDSARHCCAVT